MNDHNKRLLLYTTAALVAAILGLLWLMRHETKRTLYAPVPVVRDEKTDGQRQFEELTSSATRLIIRSHTLPDETVVFDSTNRDLIADWIKTVDLDEDHSSRKEEVKVVSVDLKGNAVTNSMYVTVSRGICGCGGSHTFLFFRGGSELISFTFHHMHHIRTSQIYGGGDVDLRPESAKKLAIKLEALGKGIPTESSSVCVGAPR